jgi:hypothetical protein
MEPDKRRDPQIAFFVSGVSAAGMTGSHATGFSL